MQNLSRDHDERREPLEKLRWVARTEHQALNNLKHAHKLTHYHSKYQCQCLRSHCLLIHWNVYLKNSSQEWRSQISSFLSFFCFIYCFRDVLGKPSKFFPWASLSWDWIQMFNTLVYWFIAYPWVKAHSHQIW